MPTGGSVAEGAERFLAELGDSSGRMSNYFDRAVLPQAGRVADAIGPIIDEGKERGSYEAVRAEKLALEVARQMSSLGPALSVALAGGGGDPVAIAGEAHGKVDSLAGLLRTLAWKSPERLAAAEREVERLKGLLQWEAIQSKVIE